MYLVEIRLRFLQIDSTRNVPSGTYIQRIPTCPNGGGIQTNHTTSYVFLTSVTGMNRGSNTPSSYAAAITLPGQLLTNLRDPLVEKIVVKVFHVAVPGCSYKWEYLGRWLQIDPDDCTNTGQAEYGCYGPKYEQYINRPEIENRLSLSYISDALFSGIHLSIDQHELMG
ncbi:hypothetical protein M747DRAFT_306164 [Aspergillus niger ATCC 13496]|uniref:Uncharacterized protein n=1 Tax=Aspergillus niger ATCC 13496 TaxID=1353008 RepID=A0A370BWM9_ASPNG|nr:hypothetical protein M747DRAFT_306164 [Aspergillus niger ATCC 13496]